jgi:RHS repeat-associated protein
MGKQHRVALKRVGPAHPDDHGPAIQFHLGDHLGSSNVVIDLTGAFLNREEFTPYGETSFGSFAKKRYRFTGKERDEESGLSYHSARYYAAWTTKWTNTDPIGIQGGMNLYTYCHSSPVTLRDTQGTSPEEPPDKPVSNTEEPQANAKRDNTQTIPRPNAEPPKGIIAKSWGWLLRQGRVVIPGLQLITSDPDDLSRQIEATTKEIEDLREQKNKARPPIRPPKEPEQGGKRILKIRDLHENRNLGNAEPFEKPDPNRGGGIPEKNPRGGARWSSRGYLGSLVMGVAGALASGRTPDANDVITAVTPPVLQAHNEGEAGAALLLTTLCKAGPQVCATVGIGVIAVVGGNTIRQKALMPALAPNYNAQFEDAWRWCEGIRVYETGDDLAHARPLRCVYKD